MVHFVSCLLHLKHDYIIWHQEKNREIVPMVAALIIEDGRRHQH